MCRKEVETGPSGPVFLWVLLVCLLPACTPLATQPPVVVLDQVHESGAHRLAFSPDGRRLASGGYRGEVIVWSTDGGVELQRLGRHTGSVTGLAWIDNRFLVSADRTGWLYVQDAVTGELQGSLQLPVITDLAIAPDSRWAVVLSNGEVYRIALPSMRVEKVYASAARAVSVAVARSGDIVALSLVNRQVLLLDSGLNELRMLERPTRNAYDLVFSADGRQLLAGGWFRLLRWELSTGRLTELPTEHLGKVYSVDASADGRRWLSLARDTDSRLQVYDASTGQVERRLQPHRLCGQRARFSPDGRYIASSSDDGSVHIYDLGVEYRPVVQYPEN